MVYIAYLGIIAMYSYCAAMILIGLPCSIWEAITKHKINRDAQKKVISKVAIIIGIVLAVRFLYEKASGI